MDASQQVPRRAWLRTRGSRGLLPYALLAAYVVWQVPHLLQPLTGTHHLWRQADTAAVARNLAFEAPDIFHPRTDMRGATSGITGMEFPLYQAVTAVLMRVTGSDADGWAKAVSLVCAVACWLLLAHLLVSLLGLRPWAAHVGVAAIPVFLAYGDKMMPETMALLLALVGVERVAKHGLGDGPTVALAQAGVAFALAALVRPYVVFMGLPLLVAAVLSLRKAPGRAAGLWLAGALALVPMALWYGWWSPHLVKAFGSPYFFMGSPLKDNVALLSTRALWRDLVDVLSTFYVKKPMYAVVMLGIAAAPARFSRGQRGWWAWSLLLVPVVAVPALLLVIGGHFQPHIYYLFALVPSVALALALGLDLVLRRAPLAFVPLAALALASAAAPFPTHFAAANPEWEMYDNVMADVDRRVRPLDLMVVEDLGAHPWHLHRIRRKGWVEARESLMDPDRMALLHGQGARWVLAVAGEPAAYHLFAMDQWLAMLAAGTAPHAPLPAAATGSP